VKTIFQGRKGILTALALIVVLGAFLRLYHLSDWLHFELDQARDAKVITSAIEGGIGNLPLLGPRAGGTFLRLGPGFYYVEYIGALIFGNTPGGLTVPIALLSIASIAVLYVLMRRYFETKLSLALALLFSVSVFFVLYGRFAWNPNPLPFFLLCGFYALLKAVDTDEPYRERWFVASALLLSFATQLHFLAFVALPFIVVVFLSIKRVRFSWRAWVMAMCTVLLLYVPMILNEVITGGANSQEFLAAVQGKSNKSQHTIAEQFIRNTTNQAEGYWVILSGYEDSSMGQFVSTGLIDFELTCNDNCHKHLIASLTALMIFIGGTILLIWNTWKETDVRKKDFLILAIAWFGSCFVLFTPLSYDFSPRFFLLTAPFPFLFIGLIVDFLKKHCTQHAWISSVLWVLLSTLVFSNLFYVSHRFDALRRASSEYFEIAPDRILKEKTRVTLEQQERVLDYMQSFQKENGYPIYMFSEPEHRRALKYLMERRGMQNDVVGFSGGVYSQGNHFLVFRTGSNHTKTLNKKYTDVYTVIEKVEFGTLTIIRLQPKTEMITGERQIFEEKAQSTASAPGVPERYTWSEWWNHQSGSADDEATDDMSVSDSSE